MKHEEMKNRNDILERPEDEAPLNDLGVLSDSVRYYHEADRFTRHNLFYIPRAGIYHCDRSYLFERKASDISTCQIILVDEGELEMIYCGEHHILRAGRMAVMHLGQPNLYRTSGEEVRMRWVHLEGHGCLPYIKLIQGVNGARLNAKNIPGVRELYTRLFQLVEEADDGSVRVTSDTAISHEISVCIHQIFAMLCRPVSDEEQSGLEQILRESAHFMQLNFSDRDLSVEALSKNAGLSVSYYLRNFRELFGETPHQYLRKLRVRQARELLDTTSLSVEEIADRCGFCNASHLISVFRKDTGMTPLKFRNLWR